MKKDPNSFKFPISEMKPSWSPPMPKPSEPLSVHYAIDYNSTVKYEDKNIFAPPPVFFTTEEKLTEKQIETMKNEILKNFKRVGHKMLVLEPTTDTKWTSAIGEKDEPKKDPERKITY